MIWKKNYKKLLITLCLITNPAQAEFRHFKDWTAAEKRLFLGDTANFFAIETTNLKLASINSFLEDSTLSVDN